MAAQCAKEKNDSVRFLLELSELELIEREKKSVKRRVPEAGFPVNKTLNSFDFKAIPSLNKRLVMELARCEYIQKRENVLAESNSGTGKTHLAIALGLCTCQEGCEVKFFTAARVGHGPDRGQRLEGFAPIQEATDSQEPGHCR